MKLRTRFLLGYLILALVTLALGIFALFTYGRINQEVTALQKDVIPGAISMLETNAAVKTLVSEADQYARSNDQTYREHAADTIIKIQANTTQHTDQEQAVGAKAGQAALNIKNRAASIISLSEAIMDAADTNASTQAQLEESMEEMGEEIEALLVIFEEHVAEHMSELDQAELAMREKLGAGDSIEADFDTLLQDIIPGALSMLQTQAAVEGLRGEISEMISSGLFSHKGHIEEAISLIQQNTAEHTTHAQHLGVEEGQVAQDIEDRAAHIIDLARQVMTTVDAANANQAAMEYTDILLYIEAKDLEKVLAEQVTEHMEELDTAQQNVSGAYQSGVLAVWVAIGVALLLCLGVAFVTVRMVLGPISQLTQAAERISGGDLESEVSVDSSDETGLLANSFNQMVRRIRAMLNTEIQQRAQLENTVKQYVDYSTAVGQGNLSLRLKLDGGESGKEDDPLIMLGQQLNDTTAQIQEMIGKIRSTAQSLGSAASEILASTTQQVSNASEQSAAISQTTTTVDEVKNIAEQTVARAQEVADAAQRSVDFSRGGQQAVQNNVDSMGKIKSRVESIAENILALSEQTQQIGDIISTVNDIASQSNMLALNASVEAARAGEQGKGFSVVAMEVRSLAEQSKQATSQVEAILSDIQKATNMTVMATEEGTKGVEEGVGLSAKTGEVIQQLGSVITESAQAAMQMVAGGQQQTSGIDQIALAMQNINQATTQSLASTRQAEKAARDLNDLARSLTEIVEQYQQ